MTPIKSVPHLLDLLTAGYNRALPDANGVRGDYQPIFNKDGTLEMSFCNQFVQSVLSGFGITDLNGLDANHMMDRMRTSQDYFPVGDDNDAQNWANEGALVIVGAQGPVHGHVAILLPGRCEVSPSFNRPVAKVVSVGRDVFFGKRMSFAFKPADQPIYFIPRSMTV